MTTMTYHVHSVEQDMAGKWYARVCITEEEAVFLKFQQFPTMDAIQDAAIRYVESLIVAEEPDGPTEVVAEEPDGPTE